MKRAVIIFGVLVVFVATLFLMTPMFISSDTVKSRILSEVQNLTGRTMTFRGSPTVSFLPFLGIEISDVVIEDPSAPPNSPPFVRIDKLFGKLETLSAFFGRADIRNFRFVRPHFNFKTDGNGKANWIFDKGNIRDVLDATSKLRTEGETADPVPYATFGRFEIVDGIANYENEISGVMETVTSINGTIIWPDSNSQLLIKMGGIWQGEQLNFTGDAEEPIQLMSGGNSEIEFNMKSAPLDFNFVGVANLISDLHLVGEFNMHSPSANRMGEFLGVTLLDGLVIGELEGAGKLEMKPNKAQLTEAAITLDGSRSVGAISISIDEKNTPKLDGTLAFDAIDITKLLEAVSDKQAGGDDTETSLHKLSLDMRISSNTVSVYDLAGTDFAAALSVREGNWALDVGNLVMFGGKVTAKIEAQLEADSPKFAFNITASETNFAEVATLLNAKIIQPSGTLNFKLDVTTAGTNRLTLIRNIMGTLEASANDGQINGIDLTLLDAIFSEEKKRVSFDELSGRTVFDKAEFEFLINRGIAWISEGAMYSPGREMALSGNFDMLLGGLAIQAKMRQVEQNPDGQAPNPDQPPKTEKWNNFIIGGTFGSPLLTRWPASSRSFLPPTKGDRVTPAN
ncbi:MAG: AsmA family protein [Rhizobiaceae bacterium]|nr:AsmA family protein [Rhizobiaceae bacterium]